VGGITQSAHPATSAASVLRIYSGVSGAVPGVAILPIRSIGRPPLFTSVFCCTIGEHLFSVPNTFVNHTLYGSLLAHSVPGWTLENYLIIEFKASLCWSPSLRFYKHHNLITINMPSVSTILKGLVALAPLAAAAPAHIDARTNHMGEASATASAAASAATPAAMAAAAPAGGLSDLDILNL